MNQTLNTDGQLVNKSYLLEKYPGNHNFICRQWADRHHGGINALPQE